MAEAVVADGSHATRQDVAKISPNKLDAFEGLHFGRVAVGAIFPAETQMAVADRYNSQVADGGAADISAEVFNNTFATAEGLEIHAPVFLPDGGIEGQSVVVVFLTKSLDKFSIL